MNKKAEFIIIANVIAAVIIIILIPYIYGMMIKPDDKFYTGLIGPYGDDQAFYLGWGAKQSFDGYWLFEDKYNGYSDRRLAFNLLWLIMGKIGKLCNMSILTVFHIERVISSIFLLVICYLFLHRFCHRFHERLVGLVLLSFSSGFGYICMQYFPNTPFPDLWVVESNIFLCMLWEVNLPLANAMMISSMYLGYEALWNNKPNFHIYTGISTLVLGLVYPYAVISIYFLIFLMLIYRFITDKNSILKRCYKYLIFYAPILLIPLPKVLYDGYLVLSRPELLVGQAHYNSPHILSYLASFGLLTPLALWGGWITYRKKLISHYFLIIWVLGTFIQIYLPIAFQMQLILGIQFPLIALSMVTIRHWDLQLASIVSNKKAKKIYLTGSLICIVLITTITNLFHFITLFKEIQSFELPAYMPIELKKGMDWLSKNTLDSDVIVSSIQIAPYIPIISSNRIYCGNYKAPTADFYEKQKRIKWLFDFKIQKSKNEVQAYLKNNHIEYLFFDKYLWDDGLSRFEIVDFFSTHGLCRKVFENDMVYILKVTDRQ